MGGGGYTKEGCMFLGLFCPGFCESAGWGWAGVKQGD